MLTRSAEVGELILDAAGFVSTQAVRNACGLDFVQGFSFYVGNRFGVSRTQLEIAFDSGRTVMPNREARANEALFSTPGPVYEIDQARSIMDKWGLDWQAVPCIDSAVDYWAPTSDWPVLDDWWHRYADHAESIGFWGGYYGFTAYGNHLIAQDWWPATFPTWTWGGSGLISGTAVKQHFGYPSGNDYSSIGVTVDENVVHGGLVVATSFDATTTRSDDMRWFVANAQVFPAFDDENGVHWDGPNADKSWPPGWLVFEMVQGGKVHTLGPEWWAMNSTSLGTALFQPGPVQVAQVTWETTGWIQSMPNRPVPKTGTATVDQAAIKAGCNAVLWDDTASTGGQQAIIKGVTRTLADEKLVPDAANLAGLRSHFEHA